MGLISEPSERNIQTVLILHDLQKNVPGFQASTFGTLNLPGNYKEASEYCMNPKNFYHASDRLRRSFGGIWYASDLFIMPEKYYQRDPISLAHAQLEITKSDLRDTLATVEIYSYKYPYLRQFEEILENIMFSLNGVHIHDENAIHMSSMRDPLL
jgi:hypothetical protein